MSATALRDPLPCIALVFQNFSGTTSTKETKRVPIPPGHEPELALLQQKIREHCRTASVHLLLPA